MTDSIVRLQENLNQEGFYLPKNIFNLGKGDYEKAPLFFGEEAGLLDSINKSYPKLWTLYKTQKQQDWSENEFEYWTCRGEFEKANKLDYDRMIKNLAWQWEGDSIAARSIMAVLGPIVSSAELKLLYERIVDNENLHALTYSEIARMSFVNPQEIMREVLSVRESAERMTGITRVLDKALKFSAWYAYQKSLGNEVKVTQEMHNIVFMFFVAMMCLERMQFMSSFAVTFAFGQEGRFVPIAKAVQKICADEFEIHVQAAIEVLSIYIQTPEGATAFKQCKNEIVELITNVHTRERNWTAYSFPEGTYMEVVNGKMMQQFNDFGATHIASVFNLEEQLGFKPVYENPLVYFNKWVDISKVQSSPQEEQNAQYKLDLIVPHDEKKIFQFSPYNF